MKGRSFFLTLALPALLTGCGLIAAFVPPIEVADPFGAEGQSLTTTFGGVASSSLNAGRIEETALTPQAESQAQGTFTRTFDDQDLDLRGFSLARLDVQMGLDPVVSLARPVTAQFPRSFTIIRTAGAASLNDEANGAATLTFDHALSLVFARDGACDLAALSCSYRYVSDKSVGDEEALASALSLSASDRATLTMFVAIIRLNGQNTPNTGRFTLELAADSEPSLDGFSATFTLRSGKATIKVGG